jgi:hypothetical protein
MKKGKKTVKLNAGNTQFDRGNTKFDSGNTKLNSGDTEFIAQKPGGTQKHPAKPSQPKEMKFIE